MLDIDGKPVVGKRVRYFNSTIPDIDFNEIKNLLQESESDTNGRIVFDRTYNSDLGWVNMVLAPDSNNIALNSVRVLDKVDTIFFDKLIPFKLRVKNQSKREAETYLSANVSISTGINASYNRLLLNYYFDTPLKAPFDIVLNTKVPSKANCLSSTFVIIQNTTMGDGVFRPFYSSSFRDSMLLIEL